jgi:putative membrane protein
MRLVVCIDRDDDLGRKAQIVGPVVGREAVLEAAIRLGISDPEDSDTNAIFAAVHLTDELRGTGDEVEVCVLTGAARVGPLSDRRVAQQLDQVLGLRLFTAAHLVSDGAEDEFLFPLVSSRLKIDGVHRVCIRQAASIESTYYTVLRALKDPKLRAKTVLPFAIVLLILGIGAAGGFFLWGIIGMTIVLGIYLIFWTFDIDEAIFDGVRSASSDIRQGSIAFGFGLFSIALVGVGFLTGYNGYLRSAPTSSAFVSMIAFFLQGLLWWIAGAVIWECGRALRRYIATGRFPRSWAVAMISILGIGSMSYGILFVAEYLDGVTIPRALAVMIGFVVAGFALVIGAAVLHQRIRGRSPLAGLEPASS